MISLSPRALPVALLAVALPGALAPAPAPAPGTGAAAEPLAPAALVRRCVDAYGGKAALERASRVRQEGRVTSALSPGAAGHLVRLYERPRRLRVEIAYPGKPVEVRVLDGSRGWRFGEEVAGPMLDAMVLQAARLDLPGLLAASEARLEDRGTVEHDGKRLRVLAVQVGPGLLVEAGIDPASGRIVRSRGSRAGAMPLEFVTTYSDFRMVKGVLVAFREANRASGQATGETTLEKVEFPQVAPAGSFRPP